MSVADLTLEGLVHDLNNVFHTIAESADLLSSDPKWVHLAQKLQHSADCGARIARSLLESNGSGADLAPVIENAAEFCRHPLGFRNGPKIEFTYEIDSEFRLRGDAASWERVMVNLFLNSAQAGARNIHVRACENTIVVTDDGAGIAPELLPRIFERGVSTKSIISGLGLSVVRSIVEQNGGTVTAANGAHGGAVFTIRL